MAVRGWGRFGEQADAFTALRSTFSRRVAGTLLPGELSAAAFLHVVDPDDGQDAARLAEIDAMLEQPLILAGDAYEVVLALDWCWDALDPEVRREFLIRFRGSADPFTAADSPLDHRVFRAKLAGVALALAVDQEDDPSPSWAALRAQLLDAAREYFSTTFPTYVRWRGLIPTGPAVAAVEENDTALAIELAGLLSGSDAWAGYADTVGRWMEHYLLVGSTHPALQHQFLRDDGSTAPLTPAARWDAMLPVTAHLIASRTRNAAAARVADAVEALAQDPAVSPSASLWRWVPVVFDLAGVPRADTNRLPPARNLDGAIVLRGGASANAAVIWIDTDQPFLRRGQHFDAGGFLIRASGYLAVAGGDDIEFEATHAKQGEQGLGRDRGREFEFAQYFSSTIAHNCMLFWDAARVPRWHGQRFAPVGGQVPREGTCMDFATPLDVQGRETGKLLAYGHTAAAAYAALDLGTTYDPRTVASHTREFVLLWGRVLVVIDRATPTNSRVVPTWVINVPARPRVDGAELASAARIAGSDNDAGVWRYDRADWLWWSDRGAALGLKPLLPAPRRVAIVGGPARRDVIEHGDHRGRSYVGGNPDSFERLVVPSGRPRAANAWYRLGRPTLLGPQFGQRRHWGRVEIEAEGRRGQVLFVQAMVIDTHPVSGVYQIEVTRADRRDVISVTVDGEAATVELAEKDLGGEVRFEAIESRRWPFPRSVEVDAPLPTLPTAGGG